jgi:Anti-sigma factor NepR
MHEDDELPDAKKARKLKSEDAAALPAQLGQKLRTLFADVESQPVPDRLRELLEALAAKEKKPE